MKFFFFRKSQKLVNNYFQLQNKLNFYSLPKTIPKYNFENKSRNQEPLFRTVPKPPLIVSMASLYSLCDQNRWASQVGESSLPKATIYKTAPKQPPRVPHNPHIYYFLTKINEHVLLTKSHFQEILIYEVPWHSNLLNNSATQCNYYKIQWTGTAWSEKATLKTSSHESSTVHDINNGLKQLKRK